MRPKTILLFVVLFLAALCDPAEPRPAQPQNPNTDSSTQHQSLANSSFTFADFKQKYGKHYSSVAEENYRRLIFEKNLRKLNAHNSNTTRKYNMKPNAFMDVSRNEFQSVYATARPSDRVSKNVTDVLTKHKYCKNPDKCRKNNDTTSPETNDTEKNNSESLNSQLPSNNSNKNNSASNFQSHNNSRLLQNDFYQTTDNIPIALGTTTASHTPLLRQITSQEDHMNNSINSETQNQTSHQTETIVAVDWTLFAGPVRFQGYCGACYAFSTVDTVSAHYNIYHFGFFLSLSVQQIIDCTNNSLTYGCNGGYLQGSLTQIQMNGIVSEESYPFTSGSSGFSGTCKLNGGPFKVASFEPLAVGVCSSVVNQLHRGPVSAGISGYNLRFYDSGVFDDCSNTDSLDHAVMIVGYKTGIGWKIKNSWGLDWGDNGFGWVAEGNTCGICNMTVAIVL